MRLLGKGLKMILIIFLFRLHAFHGEIICHSSICECNICQEMPGQKGGPGKRNIYGVFGILPA